jgi:actin-related protein
MKPSTIYSKSGKGVQEASGKTSLLKRADRAVLSAIDGRATLGEVAQKVGKSFDGEFEKLIAQLDKEGFVREVAAAASAASQSRPAVATAKSAAKAPAAKSSSSGGADDLDFTTIMPAIKPAARPLASAAAPSKAQVSDAAQRAKEQESALYKARQEAEAKAQAERDRIKQEAEAKARVEAEAKARLDAENRLREEAIGRAKAAAEAQVKAARAKAEAEALAKLDAERRVREEVERKVREEAERALREAEALRQRLEEERKAREEVERKRREDEERRRMEEEERRARAEAERKAREEAERKRREEEERKRREEEEKKRRAEEERRIEEEARRLREEIEAKAREAAELARREAEDRLLREKEEQVRRAKEAEEARMLQARAMEEARLRVRQRERERDPEENRGRSKSKDETRVAQPTLPAAAAPDASGAGSLDALMADLDSFSQREEEERQAREVVDRESREEGRRKAQAEAERRAQEDAERQMREQLEREAREQEERQRRDEEERRAREEAERSAREAEESRRLEAEERKRKAQEALLAKAAPLPDIEVSDKDLDMTEVRRDEAAVARDARKAQREREREARQRAKEAKEHAKAAAREASAAGKYPKVRRKINWGRPVAVTLLTLLAAGLVALHVIPLPMDDYERAASDALGRPVKIGTGRLSLYSGLRLNLEDLSVDGSTTIARARAHPSFRALIEGRQVLDRLELSGVTVPQAAIAAVTGAKLRGDGFRGARVFAKDLRLTGPVPLPVLEGEARIGLDGAVNSVILSGPDGLAATLTPTAGGEVEFDVTAANLTIPFAPELTLSTFAMKGKANRQGMNIASWGGGVLDGAVSGTANLRWSGAWQLEGGFTARAINAAAFAPALLSEGKAEGQARFSMSGKDPAKLSNAAYLEGNFSVGKGALGTIDLARVLHTSGRQYGGRTQFTEMTGHATYDRGAVALRNVNITAGALTAGANADIAPSGAIAGRIVADIRTTVQPLRAILVIGGTVKEPQVRN